MELSKTNLKNALALIFFGLLMFLIDISIPLRFGGVSINLSITNIAGIIMVLIAALKLRDHFKSAKILFYVSIGALVFMFVPLVNLAISNNIQADVEYLSLILNRINSSATNGSVNYSDLNEMLSIFGEITGSLIGMLAISSIASFVPGVALIYFIGELIGEICVVRELEYGDKVKRNARLSIIFMVLTEVLAILVVWVIFSGFSNIRFADNGALENSGGLGTIGLGVFLALPLLAVAICYLVFFIKLLISVNRVMNENNQKPEINDTNHYDVIDNRE